MASPSTQKSSDGPASLPETFLVFLKLGVSCFGGPVAHLGYFHDEFVVRRKWLDDSAYADIVALCQFLPGPSSSQVGLAIGLHRSGWPGALAAWLGFTLPSALLMTAFAFGLTWLGPVQHAGWLAGLKLAALAVVAQAVWAMGTKFCTGAATLAIALAGAALVLASPSGWAQILVITLGGLTGVIFFRDAGEKRTKDEVGRLHLPYGRRCGFLLLTTFLLLLFGLPAVSAIAHSATLTRLTAFYRAGSLVFGGGHVVLPLLQAGVVKPGWVTDDQFLAGYGAAQAVPGPLFSFAAYLGAVMKPPLHGVPGAIGCLVAIYLPASLLVFSALPFWETLRRQEMARSLLQGANAAVVGILLAALYRPVWTSAVHGPGDFAIALAALALLVFMKCPPWLVVIGAALAGEILLHPIS
jgi:chromate transporter